MIRLTKTVSIGFDAVSASSDPSSVLAKKKVGRSGDIAVTIQTDESMFYSIRFQPKKQLELLKKVDAARAELVEAMKAAQKNRRTK